MAAVGLQLKDHNSAATIDALCVLVEKWKSDSTLELEVRHMAKMREIRQGTAGPPYLLLENGTTPQNVKKIETMMQRFARDEKIAEEITLDVLYPQHVRESFRFESDEKTLKERMLKTAHDKRTLNYFTDGLHHANVRMAISAEIPKSKLDVREIGLDKNEATYRLKRRKSLKVKSRKGVERYQYDLTFVQEGTTEELALNSKDGFWEMEIELLRTEEWMNMDAAVIVEHILLAVSETFWYSPRIRRSFNITDIKRFLDDGVMFRIDTPIPTASDPKFVLKLKSNANSEHYVPITKNSSEVLFPDQLRQNLIECYRKDPQKKYYAVKCQWDILYSRWNITQVYLYYPIDTVQTLFSRLERRVGK